MLKQILFAILLISIAFGLVGCAQSEPDTVEVDAELEITFEGPAFVLFFTDP